MPRALRRQVLGRRNWLFGGGDDAAEVNTTFVTPLASCRLHVEPWAYLRDLFCLLPGWPVARVLELARCTGARPASRTTLSSDSPPTSSGARCSSSTGIAETSSSSPARGSRRDSSNAYLEVIIDILPPEAQPQFAQVAELITALNGIEPDLPTIVLGDFSSPAPDGPTYQQMTGAGFTDVWTRAGTAVPGLTCCQAEVATNPESQLFERIDFVWTKNITLHEPVVAFTIGDSDTFRTASEPRLWPSDHAGVIAPLRF